MRVRKKSGSMNIMLWLRKWVCYAGKNWVSVA